MKDKAERAKDKVEQKSESVMEKTKDKAHTAKEKISNTMSRVEAKNTEADIRDTQEALRAKGFDPGPSDGRLGPKTRAAIQDFQKAENLSVTGQIDDATATKLNVRRRANGSDTTSASPSTDPTLKPKQKP
jgi:peptidoglycan hydrolase-like protein with peptidoglycan-binding domain